MTLQVLCIFLLLIGRVVNIAVPTILAKLISIFDEKSNESPWPYLFGYAALRFLQGAGGLAALRDVRLAFYEGVRARTQFLILL